MESRYIYPHETHQEKQYDRRSYGYTDQLMDMAIIELKQCPNLIALLKARLIDNACQLMLETDHTTPDELRKNTNVHYQGRAAELQELIKLSTAVKNPNYKEE